MEFAELKARFEESGDGAAVLERRSAQADELLARLYQAEWPNHESEGLCLAAVGGYGRAELFPYSDLDLLFLATDDRALKAAQPAVAAFTRTLWDLQWRVFHTLRTIDDCGRLDRGNLGFTISLLDARYLVGDRGLFDRLREAVLPHLVSRDGDELARHLIDDTSARHSSFSNTIYQLEPDVKTAPGGLRDWHVARWLDALATRANSAPSGGGALALASQKERATEAAGFLTGARCLLHFSQGRNDNLLTYALHEEAARLGLGINYGTPVEPEEWMRAYYRHVRHLDRYARAALEAAQRSRSSLFSAFQDWRSRLSNSDFLVSRGRIFPRSRVPGDLPLVLSMFELSARHSLDLSTEAGAWVEASLPAIAPAISQSGTVQSAWPSLRRILALPGAAAALRAMHELGFLRVIIPAFQALDSLVVRDFYHRYTVDEHTFMAVQKLNDLRSNSEDESALAPWRAKFGEMLNSLQRPDLLVLAVVLHDLGKGAPGGNHVETGTTSARGAAEYLGLDDADQEAVLFLVANHLLMSETVSRRDIFDPETVRAFAATAGSSERLKMLCLLTYADISGVNPGAMTPWKAEMLWQLYARTENYLARSVDEDRLAPEDAPGSEGDAGAFQSFLSGFPRRYLAAHSPLEVREHFKWSASLARDQVIAKVKRRDGFGEITVLAGDRPFLFASVCGTLAAWGMNILRAEAFANRSGVVLDIFQFDDLHRTLEQNPEELARLEESVAGVATGRARLDVLMRARTRVPAARRSRVKTVPQVSFDDQSSARCTILDLVADDRTGLLYEVSQVLARVECNIEVALITTEAQKAIDVFYLTLNGAKLPDRTKLKIKDELLQILRRA